VNFAAVFAAPVVFLIQNNQYAISVPLRRQSAAPALAYKGVGYGARSEQVDGNDVLAVLAVLAAALEHARSGLGPVLVEAHTYRMGPHTSTDDPSRYRDEAETELWRARDPISRLEAYLAGRGLVDVAGTARRAETGAADLRRQVAGEVSVDPASIFDHVYAAPPPSVAQQRSALRAELAEPLSSNGGRP
jgi:pyruvate dehydrogenase E1 component alpha subunit